MFNTHDFTRCDCRDMVCHSGATMQFHLVRLDSRSGGRGVEAVLSDECRDRRMGWGLTVLQSNVRQFKH